ncbi:MAG TPA: alpha/beta hydrolase [Clostridiaceae bacterium]|nr:alpha/beta hydrolase [Clostridiaceae bacterium]
MRISGMVYVPRRTHRLRKILVVLLILILLSAIVIAGISAFTAWKVIHPPKEDIMPFSLNIAPEYKDAKFPSNDGSVILSGWFFEKKDSNKTVILSHDYGKNRLQFGEQTLDIVKGLLNKGYNVLAFDFRNSGKSGGSVTTISMLEKEDLLGAVKYAKESCGSKHIVLMGFSMGASTSLLTAAESSDVDAVIADSPFSDFNSYLKNRLIRWKLPEFPFNVTIPFFIELFTGTEIEKLDIESAVKKIAPKPVLFIHGSKDAIVRSSEVSRLASLYSSTGNANAEFWECEGSGHLDAYSCNPDAYLSKVLEFLDTLKFE